MMYDKFVGVHKEVCRDSDSFRQLFEDCTKVEKKTARYYSEWQMKLSDEMTLFNGRSTDTEEQLRKAEELGSSMKKG